MTIENIGNFSKHIDDIVCNAQKYHDAYYRSEIFSGPSLYFHKRCMESLAFHNWDQHLEYIYATLASWGMHRMGKGGSKMIDFITFKESVISLKEDIINAQHYDIMKLGSPEWETIRKIFLRIKVMATETSLVGNSKVMAHLLPNLIPPIDRQYTLNYLYGKPDIKNNIAQEWETMKCIVSEFFIPVASTPHLSEQIRTWMSNQEQFPWDTSPLKVIDNLVIGSFKM